MNFLSYVLITLFGLCIGSFLNAWIWRTHEGLKIQTERSVCPRCRKKIRWYDNIPVVSFLVLRGKCRECKGKISWQYPLVEIVTAGLYVFVLSSYKIVSASQAIVLVKDLLVVSLLIAIFVYDFLYGEILDRMSTIPAFFLLGFSLFFKWQTPKSLLLGILIGAGFFLFQYIVSRGRWIGGGDVRFGFLMGVVLGFPRILVAFLFAYILGAFISLILISFKKKTLASTTPFGTYLAIGTFLALMWGQRVIDWYSSFLL